MRSDVLGLEELDQTMVSIAGGKGANLGELTRIDGVRVPTGFCVTTSAFARIVAAAPSIAEPLDRLSVLGVEDRAAIRATSAELRRAIEAITLPDDLVAAISDRLAPFGHQAPWAVRSSATAEDLPTASFAGQQDSYLNVVGEGAVLQHVSRCWASLFTERAVTYRLRNGVDQRAVHMAVVVQAMVQADAAGVLFTADPVSGNRKVCSVEAGVGLGEDLVSGRVVADAYEVRDGEVTTTAIAPAHQGDGVLGTAQVVELAALGRQIEAHFGHPQDIEWCLAGGAFHIVQSRPITTLFPIPVADDDANHVYVSVGHQQMMTDAMKPLGLSLWQLIALRPMHEAGGRLFVDVTLALASSASRDGLIDALGKSEPLIGDALRTIVGREGFLPSLPDAIPGAPPPASAIPEPIAADPTIVAELVEQRQDSLAELQRDIGTRSGPALLDFILDDIGELKRLVFEPRSRDVIMAGMEATWWLNDQLEAWLGEKNVADVLTRSVSGNVTSEMGLALLDVADAIRPHPEVVAFLERVEGDDFVRELDALDGGALARDAIEAFLERDGMRCVGEIDITRPRWSERPSTLLPVILGNVRAFAPGEARRRFDQGQAEAAEKEQDVLARLRSLPDGSSKADETKAMIDRVRAFAGYREYPKYVIVNRTFVYKQALLAEAERLVDLQVLRDQEDLSFLTFHELYDLVGAHEVDLGLIDQRKAAFRSYEQLTPPRVLTSEGEGLTGAYRREDVPSGALVGVAVSRGTVEGRARVIHDLGEADLDAGDILVTTSTDPSWSPLFVAIAGLVTEVGGLMTHGAVIAREYGLPAVVCVEAATQRIRDRQRIRVHGTDGFVELLD